MRQQPHQQPQVLGREDLAGEEDRAQLWELAAAEAALRTASALSAVGTEYQTVISLSAMNRATERGNIASTAGTRTTAAPA